MIPWFVQSHFLISWELKYIGVFILVNVLYCAWLSQGMTSYDVSTNHGVGLGANCHEVKGTFNVWCQWNIPPFLTYSGKRLSYVFYSSIIIYIYIYSRYAIYMLYFFPFSFYVAGPEIRKPTKCQMVQLLLINLEPLKDQLWSNLPVLLFKKNV